ncbi:F-box/RNI superfamily protein [Medicago truncatula]|uniref:F-box/RNI superfamily protein n=1 Tax=Medicago truncatula TaxID=3880 RepID=A0A072UHT2_MEDTR|nr:F-box/RNI superfamily protein [Medicago truncatula]
MNLMLMAAVAFWHYWVFLLLQEIRKQYNGDDNADKLSDLPDCVLLHILSFLNTKYAVQTCVLSKRWKNLWKCLPSLKIGYSNSKCLRGSKNIFYLLFRPRYISSACQVFDFKEPQNFEKFLNGCLSNRDQSIPLQVFDCVGPQIHIESIVKTLPQNLFKLYCHTLTSLHVSVASPQRTLFPNSLNFPALTSLSLWSFDFRVVGDGNVEPFSAFKRLKNLILRDCNVHGNRNLCISSAKLINLAIDYCNLELYTPSLCTFVYKGIPTVQQLCGSKSNLSSVKHVNIDVNIDAISLSESVKTSLILYNWLVELANIESLTINSTILEILYSVPNILKAEFPSLCNLKSLKVKTNLSSIPNGYLAFLLQNAPSAKMTTEVTDVEISR